MTRGMDAETRSLLDSIASQMRDGFSDVKAAQRETNGRVRKAEVSIAVLWFAVMTVGAGLAYAGMQIVVARLTGQ